MSAKTCDICRKPIQPGSKYKTTNLQNFHKECFKCAQCGKLLEYEYCESNGRFYCSKDYDELFAPKCDKCFKGITEEHIQYRGKKFHNHCFSCLKCGKRVDVDNFFRVEDKGPYCEPCADTLTGEGHGSHGGSHGSHAGAHASHGDSHGAVSHGGAHGGVHGGVHGGAHGGAHTGVHGGVHGGSAHGGVHGGSAHGGAHGGVHGGAHGGVHGGGNAHRSHSNSSSESDDDDHDHDHGHPIEVHETTVIEVHDDKSRSRSSSKSSSSSDHGEEGLEQAQAALDELLNDMNI
eukprot:TRINITY_DN476_c0_g1_i4.p1 TRINITY_DN476_c0_g1~~TRINITY_DN476_c0_g1_i4.p1  ORF type:complete len:290 (+),score=44.62 TRINITY_DN476_c0_g1_i4:789-1658(+)